MAREIPGWLRTVLNVIAIIGVGAGVMGWVERHVGIAILAFAPLYLLWEISPWVMRQVQGRRMVSLIVFIVIGGCLGAISWWMWKRTAVPPAPLVTSTPVTPTIKWDKPNPIVVGTPLTNMQLDAMVSVEGAPLYIPDVGTILPVGSHTLTFKFTPTDQTKYAVATATVSIIVIPAPLSPLAPRPLGAASVPHDSQQGKSEDFVYIAPMKMGMLVDPNAPKYMWDFHVLLSNSKAPAYNVNVIFSDDIVREEMGRKNVYTVADQNKLRLVRAFDEIDVLDRNILKPPGFTWTPPHIEHERYYATITWRGGNVSESLAIEKRFDNWLYAMTVKDNESGEVLIDCKDKGFPYGPEKPTNCFPEVMSPQTLIHIPNPAN